MEEFKTYHFDYRGSTVAITDASGKVTDAFRYDTYGRMTEHIGSSDVIFGYNGRDGVVTDKNGLIYMRARYYSPKLRRFVNADVVAGKISNAITLNRYAYANGNPVSNIDPFGLSTEHENNGAIEISPIFAFQFEMFLDKYYAGKTTIETLISKDILEAFYDYMYHGIKNTPRPNNIGIGIWNKQVEKDLLWLEKYFGKSSRLAKTLEVVGYLGIVVDVWHGVDENIQNGANQQKIFNDALVDLGVGVAGGALSSLAASATAGAVVGSVAPGIGNLIGAGVGLIVGIAYYAFTEVAEINGKSLVEWAKEGLNWLSDRVKDGLDWIVDTTKDVSDQMMDGLRNGLDWITGIFTN